MSKFALLALFLLCSGNGASGESNQTSLLNAEIEVVCTCMYHLDIPFYIFVQMCLRMKLTYNQYDLKVKGDGNLCKEA